MKLRQILREVERQGWRIREGGKHVVLYPPTGGLVTLARSLHDEAHGMGNLRNKLRRAGLRL